MDDTSPMICDTPSGEINNLISKPNDLQQRSIFIIPLSTQRYDWVGKFLQNNKLITSVTDFGCGNGRIIHWLKAVPHITHINFVDIDDIMLEAVIDTHMRPGFLELLFGRQSSHEDLRIQVYHGDISIPDQRLSSDCFLMVEIIEHMHLENLERAVRTVFGHYQPSYVIVTTPNIEFNHLLNRSEDQRYTFRHHDHKFEWTRQEFVQWAHNICAKFPYDCLFDGVGHLENSGPFGPCTQIALFTLNPDKRISTEQERNLICLDAMLDKLNVREPVSEWRVDPKQNRIARINEFVIKGRKFEDEPAQEEPTQFDWGTPDHN